MITYLIIGAVIVLQLISVYVAFLWGRDVGFKAAAEFEPWTKGKHRRKVGKL